MLTIVSEIFKRYYAYALQIYTFLNTLSFCGHFRARINSLNNSACLDFKILTICLLNNCCIGDYLQKTFTALHSE